MNIQQLEWDSEFFRVKIGKIEIFDEELFDPVEFRKQTVKDKYELVYVFKYGEMLGWSNILNSQIELVDIMLTMTNYFNKKEFIDYPYDFRTELSEKELHESYQIAEQISPVSRFYNEAKIGKIKTKELYRKWIDNALNKTFSDGLFIETMDNLITGIHLIKSDIEKKIGYFTLTGVDSKIKSSGIGTKLWKQSFGFWANESDIELIKSSFSFRNNQSFNFHLKNGFNKIESIKYIYHFRNTYI